MFELQRHSQDSNDVLHYSALLEFLDLMVQASENAVRESDHKRRTLTTKKRCSPETHSYTVNVDDQCVACKLGRHPCMLVGSLGVYHTSK